MPIGDLSDVTQTIINLIRGVLARDLSSGEDVPDVTAVPPEREANSGANARTVSVHLLHVTESGEFRNRDPGPRTRDVQIQQLPLGLVLQYVISAARSEETDANVVLDLQRIIGLIARAFHDYPVITPTLKFSSSVLPPQGFVLAGDLLDEAENLDLILRPATLEENLNFWTTQDAKLARACLFVEARVALLRPQAPTRAPGIVLSVGNFVFPSAGPQLAAAKSVILFRLPNAADPTRVEASPARVALLADVAAPFPVADAAFIENSVLRLEGTGFFPGQHFLVLKRDETTLTIDLDNAASSTNPSPPPATVSNANWSFLVGPDAVTLSFRERVVAIVDGQGPAQVARLVPGIYSARLQVLDARLPGGARPRSSNLMPFTVTPQIVGITPATGALSQTDTYELEISGNYLDPFTATTPRRKLEIELATAGIALEELAPPLPTGADGAGKFVIENPGSNLIKFRLPPVTPTPLTPSSDSPVAVLLSVNGAFAPARWLTSAGGPPA